MIEHFIKHSFEEGRQLRDCQIPVLYRHGPLLADVVNAHVQELQQVVVFTNRTVRDMLHPSTRAMIERQSLRAYCRIVVNRHYRLCKSE